MEQLNVIYFLFVIPGFLFLWTYRHFTEAPIISEFAYGAWSFTWGTVIFLAYGLNLLWTHGTFPDVRLDSITTLLGSSLGIGLGLAVSLSFPLGYLFALIAKTGLFKFIDRMLFKFIDICAR